MAALYSIRPGMSARLLDGGSLTIVEVLHNHRSAPSLVLRSGALHGRRHVVASYNAVLYVDGIVHLGLSERQVHALPAYEPVRH
jgi:hypothetical protein